MSPDAADVARLLEARSGLGFAVGVEPGRVAVLRDETLLYWLRCEREGSVVRWSVEPGVPARATDGDAGELMLAVLHASEAMCAATMTLDTNSVLVRSWARAVGFAGRIRDVLQRDFPLTADNRMTSVPDAEAVADVLADLVPGTTVRAARPPGTFRTIVRTATSGLRDTVHVTVDGPDGSRLRLVLAGRTELLFESIAEAVDTAIAVRRRFLRELAHVKTISFDRSSHGFVSGEWAGMAPAERRAGAHQRRLRDAVGWSASVTRRRTPGARPRSRRQADGSAVDLVTAHELWHHVDAGFQARRYREASS